MLRRGGGGRPRARSRDREPDLAGQQPRRRVRLPDRRRAMSLGRPPGALRAVEIQGRLATRRLFRSRTPWLVLALAVVPVVFGWVIGRSEQSADWKAAYE